MVRFFFSFCLSKMSAMARSYFFEKIDNFRDLGGYGCAYGETSFGVVYRSATIAGATPNDIEKLAKLGIKTILDLREPAKKKAAVSPTKGDDRFQTIELDVNGNGRVPVDYEDGQASYMEMLEDPYTARRIIKSIIDCPKPCLIHCNAGKDRTGVFVYLILLAAGVDFHDINADYMSSFPYLYEATAKLKEAQPNFPKVCLIPDIQYLHDFHEAFLDRYGDLEGYFEAIGLSEDDCTSFANLLGKQEKSCGAVVFKDGRVLVEHMAMGHYSLPKGHVEESDQSEEETALREIREETGLEARIIPGFKTSTVFSPSPGHIKKVIWFAAEVTGGEAKVQKDEVQDIYFLRPEHALITLTHDSDRTTMVEACRAVYPKK